MAALLPIDLTKIAWTAGDLTCFEVRGEQAAKTVLADDPTAAVAFGHRATFGFDAALGQVAIRLVLDISVGRQGQTPTAGIGGHFELYFGFTVANLTELLAGPEPAPAGEPALPPQLPAQLLLLLTSVAYSTARGILWTRLAGTPLDGITLPLLDPRELLLPAAEEDQQAKKPRKAPARARKPGVKS